MSDLSQTPQDRDFHCEHCNGRIVIPYSLPPTTGPCPHCQETITSPPPPVEAVPAQPAPEEKHEAPEAVAVPATIRTPQHVDVPNQRETPIPVQREAEIPQQRETPVPERQDTVERVAPVESRPAPPARKKSSSGIIPAMFVLIALILAGGAAVYYFSTRMSQDIGYSAGSVNPQVGQVRDESYMNGGWEVDAYAVLGAFIDAKSVPEKLSSVLNPDRVREKMEAFYRGDAINGEGPPADSFVVRKTPEEDRSRDIFMLTYEKPAQSAPKEIPSAPGTPEGLQDEGPLRVLALFKKTEDGLKLDWEVFAQSKYRTLRNFLKLQKNGQPETFRVLIAEDIPDQGQGVAGSRTYLITDPAYPDDSARVNVGVNSPAGKTLSAIDWRGTKQGTPVTRTATVELTWTGTPESPTLEISQFICWEFLGLGGKAEPAAASAE